VEHEVPVRERPALRVLSGEADRGAGDDEARERELFGLGPVDPTGLTERLAPPFQLLEELGMDGEAFGDGEELLVEPPQDGRVNGRLDRDVRAPGQPFLLLW
jgi:hypothetical protein